MSLVSSPPHKVECEHNNEKHVYSLSPNDSATNIHTMIMTNKNLIFVPYRVADKTRKWPERLRGLLEAKITTFPNILRMAASQFTSFRKHDNFY